MKYAPGLVFACVRCGRSIYRLAEMIDDGQPLRAEWLEPVDEGVKVPKDGDLIRCPDCGEALKVAELVITPGCSEKVDALLPDWDRCMASLALELPSEVWQDVKRRSDALLGAFGVRADR